MCSLSIYDKVPAIISKVHSEFNLTLCKITKTIINNGSNVIKTFKMFGKSESIIISSSDCQKNNADCCCDDKTDGDNDLLPQAFQNRSKTMQVIMNCPITKDVPHIPYI